MLIVKSYIRDKIGNFRVQCLSQELSTYIKKYQKFLNATGCENHNVPHDYNDKW